MLPEHALKLSLDLLGILLLLLLRLDSTLLLALGEASTLVFVLLVVVYRVGRSELTTW